MFTCIFILQLAQGHRVLLLEIMTKVIKDAGKDVSLEVAKELILLGSNEITKSKVCFYFILRVLKCLRVIHVYLAWIDMKI